MDDFQFIRFSTACVSGKACFRCIWDDLFGFSHTRMCSEDDHRCSRDENVHYPISTSSGELEIGRSISVVKLTVSGLSLFESRRSQIGRMSNICRLKVVKSGYKFPLSTLVVDRTLEELLRKLYLVRLTKNTNGSASMAE